MYCWNPLSLDIYIGKTFYSIERFINCKMDTNMDNFDPGGSHTHNSRFNSQGINESHAQFRSRSNSRGSISNSHGPHVTYNNNRFNSLPVDVDEHEVIRTSNDVPDPSISYKPPPITVFGVAIDKLSTLVSKKLGNAEKINYKLSQFGTKIYVNNTADYKTLRDYLLKSNLNCYTHTLKNEKTKRFVLKGLYEMNIDEIKDALLYYPSRC